MDFEIRNSEWHATHVTGIYLWAWHAVHSITCLWNKVLQSRICVLVFEILTLRYHSHQFMGTINLNLSSSQFKCNIEMVRAKLVCLDDRFNVCKLCETNGKQKPQPLWKTNPPTAVSWYLNTCLLVYLLAYLFTSYINIIPGVSYVESRQTRYKIKLKNETGW